MNVLDLFSGIGGFSLGFEREGFRTIAFCEIDAFCRDVLRKHWPHVPIYADVRDHSGLPVSGLVGSWQESRPRGLTELVDVRADWIVVENVHHTWRRWVPELRGALWRLGYSSLPLQVSARDLGACHERRRVFVVAHANSELLWQLSRWWRREGRQVAQELGRSWDWRPGAERTDARVPLRLDRNHALGNAVVPQCAQLVARAIVRVLE